LQSVYPYDEERVLMVGEWYHRSGKECESEIESMQWLLDFFPGTQSGILCNQSSCLGLSDNCTAGYPYPQNADCGTKPDLGPAPGTFLDCSQAQWLEVEVEYGKRYRLRAMNVGSGSTYFMSIQNHPLHIIAADGSTWTKEKSFEGVPMYVSQRYDFLFTANQPIGNYWIAALPFREPARVYGVIHYKGAPHLNLSSALPLNVSWDSHNHTLHFREFPDWLYSDPIHQELSPLSPMKINSPTRNITSKDGVL